VVTVLFPFFFSALAGAAAFAAGAATLAGATATLVGAVGAEAEEPMEYFYLF
jgi:sugar/nucleoside kinase (ribokinase family)